MQRNAHFFSRPVALALALALLFLARGSVTSAMPGQRMPGDVPTGLSAADWTTIQSVVRAADYHLTYHEADAAYQVSIAG